MTKKTLSGVFVATCIALLCLSNSYAFTQESEQRQHTENSLKEAVEAIEEKVHESEEKINVADIIFSHVLDGREFHFVSIGDIHVSIPLPIIVYTKQYGLEIFSSSKFHTANHQHKHYILKDEKIYLADETGTIIKDSNNDVYDFSITRSITQLLLSTIVLIILILNVSKSYKKRGFFSAPKGFQNVIEPIIIFVRDDIAKPNLGKKHEKYLPYILSVFFFILIHNIFGLIPGAANVSGNISFTLILGVLTLILMMFSSNAHYWGHIFKPPVPFFIKIIMVPIEFIGIFTKPIALIIRLFANMLAGHIIIICIICLIFVFTEISKYAGIAFIPISVGFTVFMYFLEIIVAFIQAYIFATLTALFIGQTFESELNESHNH